jgi:hypothetical protein
VLSPDPLPQQYPAASWVAGIDPASAEQFAAFSVRVTVPATVADGDYYTNVIAYAEGQNAGCSWVCISEAVGGTFEFHVS